MATQARFACRKRACVASIRICLPLLCRVPIAEVVPPPCHVEVVSAQRGLAHGQRAFKETLGERKAGLLLREKGALAKPVAEFHW